LLAALFTFEKGHLYHAAKGSCEFLRELIESLPFIGRKFACYCVIYGDWWIIKIYNPNKPGWEGVKPSLPTGYVIA
jgi:hypothetical protein